MKTTIWQDQRTPALAIVARDNQITTQIPNKTYTVQSQSNPNTNYTITQDENQFTCTCQHHKDTNRDCTHILSVKFQQSLKQQSEELQEQQITCDKCQSNNIVKNGTRKNKIGIVHRYLCKNCGYRFTDDNGFMKRRSDSEKIALALDLYFRGLSVRKVAEHFRQIYNLNVSYVTGFCYIIG